MNQPSVMHVVVTNNFAGTERYVCDVASETASRGWRVTVVGGSPQRMPRELGETVRWLPGGSIPLALASVARAGQHDVCHAHLTYAEAVGAATRRFHGGAVLATRHFAAHRGASRVGGILAPWLGRVIDKQFAISHFVDAALERPADDVVLNGTRRSSLLWRATSRRVLVLQRLESEKDTGTAVEAWRLSGLADHGWTLRVVGLGSQLPALRAQSAGLRSVEFAGRTDDVAGEFACAGMLLATATAEPFGLSVVEAMAAGIPVVATAAGGHLETVGPVSGETLFAPGDSAECARKLTRLAHDESLRERLSHELRKDHQERFTLAGHVDSLLSRYPLVTT